MHTLFIVLLVEKRWLNQNRLIFYVFLSQIWTWTCRCQKQLNFAKFVKAKKTPALKRFIPKPFCYHIHKKNVNLLKLYVFLCVSWRFSWVFVFHHLFYIFQHFHFVRLALKIHNCTDLKLVRKQHWNFNEFHFYIW